MYLLHVNVNEHVYIYIFIYIQMDMQMYAELMPKSTHLDSFCRISKLAGTEMGFGATS